jgi:hypothetical protein
MNINDRWTRSFVNNRVTNETGMEETIKLETIKKYLEENIASADKLLGRNNPGDSAASIRAYRRALTDLQEWIFSREKENPMTLEDYEKISDELRSYAYYDDVPEDIEDCFKKLGYKIVKI